MNTDTISNNGLDKEPAHLYRNFQYRSDVAQEIISTKSGFFEKWALLLFALVLLLLFAATWFIRYPDFIETRATLTAENAPKEIFALQSGRLTNLFVKTGDEVKKGQMIGWIESSADTKQVLELSGNLDSSITFMNSGQLKKLSQLFQSPYKNLGDLQAAYQVFITAFQQYNDHLINGFYTNQKSLLLKDIGTLQAMHSSIEKQEGFTKQDEDSAQKSLAMNKYLLDEKVISPEEYRTAMSAYLNKKEAIPQLNQSILNNQSQQRDKLKEIEQLDHDAEQQKITFAEALQTFKSALDDWILKYVIKAPVSGRIYFSFPLQQNKFIEQGKLLAYINPPDSKFYAELYLPQNNLGKADTGMQVQLRFDAYLYQEVGYIKGKLNYISSVASDSGFLATACLNNGLVTNQNNHIQYKNGLTAQAILITKNMRLLQRIYYNIIKSMSVGK
ncbi:MAG TPA: HlyD family efflux transporter periplasmic adaptor subunit [Chitinophagaceae bacterium]|nr:HlyD family efflux transporter periplasmic adaptor subunit [Chitinophagaceae bacterium]